MYWEEIQKLSPVTSREVRRSWVQAAREAGAICLLVFWGPEAPSRSEEEVVVRVMPGDNSRKRAVTLGATGLRLVSAYTCDDRERHWSMQFDYDFPIHYR